MILHELHLLPDARIPYASGVAHLRCHCQLLRVLYAVNTHRDTRSQTVRLSETANPPYCSRRVPPACPALACDMLGMAVQCRVRMHVRMPVRSVLTVVTVVM